MNLTKAEMDQALSFFLSLLGANVYALFFFAGKHPSASSLIQV